MKNVMLILVLLASNCAAQSTPSVQVISQTANQLLGTNVEREQSINLLISYGLVSVPYLADFLTAKETSIKTASLQVINSLGYVSSVEYCITLLDSADDNARLKATKVLSALTNKNYGYAPQNDQIKRAEIKNKWVAWLAEYRLRNNL